MKTIYKYAVPATDAFVLELPRGAKFLSVQTQRGEPQSWWLVDPRRPADPRRLRVYGTGHRIETSATLEFLGTFQLSGGEFVFHLFEDHGL